MSQTVPAVLSRAALDFADREAVVTDDVRWTFGELEAKATTAAWAFVRAGIDRGDRIAIWAPNIPEWIVAMLGVHLAGGVVVPLNTRFKGDEAADIINRSQARLVLCMSDFLDFDYVGALQRTELPGVDQIVVLRGHTPDGATSWTEFLTDAPAAALPQVEESHLSDVIYTSGTTGRPKGVMATHGQTVRVFSSWSDIVGLTDTDRYLIVNPFFHSFGYKAGIVACLIRGATMVPEPFFEVSAAARSSREGINHHAPWPADLVSVDPRSPSARRFRSVVVAARGHRRSRRAGRDDRSHAFRADLLDDSHRVWPDRIDGYRVDVPPWR